MRNLHKYIQENHGLEALQLLQEWGEVGYQGQWLQ